MGYIDWWEFAPVKDMFIVKCLPDMTKKETESGIITSTTESTVQDRPSSGTIISSGPKSTYKEGDFVYFEPLKGMDLEMIRVDGDEKYLLLYDDAILGYKTKDTRE